MFWRGDRKMGRKTNRLVSISFLIMVLFLLFTALDFNGVKQQKAQAVDGGSQIEKLTASVKQSGATIERIQLHQGKAMPAVDSLQMLWDIGESWKGNEEKAIKILRNSEGKHPYLQIDYIKQDVTARVRWIATKQGDQWKPYFIAKISGTAENQQALKEMVQQVSTRMLEHSISPKFNTCVQAFYNDKLKMVERKNNVDKILRNWDATVVEKMEDDVVQSISAYTSQLPRHIITNHQKMNLQVATHVDAVQHRTRLTVGSPIITTTY